MTTNLSRTLGTLALGATMLTAPLLGALPAAAETTSISVTNIQSNIGACPDFPRTLSYGARDSVRFSDVHGLQTYLHAHGYLSVEPTDYFGSLTRAAVMKFQRAYGVPATGVVGPLTRTAIAAHCNGGVVATFSRPTLTSMTPSQGAVGTTVTLTGSNFSGSNMVHFAYGAIQDVSSSDGTTLTFTVPNSLGPICKPGTPCPYMARLITPGDYDIYVENAYGTTSAKTFTVTDGSVSATSPTFGANRVNVPETMMARTSGTWSIYLVNATLPLSWSADWGDQSSTSTIPVLTGTGSTTIATFMHTYQNAGKFSQTFLVTDGSGQKFRVVSGVTVTPNPNQN